MTTVHPIPEFNVIKESTRERKAQRSCTEISAVTLTDVKDDITEQYNKDSGGAAGFCGNPYADKGELLASLSPLLFSMKLFGMYFERGDRMHRRRADDPEWNSATPKARTSSTKLRVFATFAVIFVWLDFLRCLSAFNRYDQFGSLLLLKIVTITWFALSAIFYTTYYYASHSGQLVKVLLTLPVTQDCIHKSRLAAVILTALIWIVLGIDLSIGFYFVTQDSDVNDIFLAPFVSYIYLPEDTRKIARVFGYVGYALVFMGIYFAHAMGVVLVCIFYSQFRNLKKNFRRALGEEGQFNGELSLFRRRHQTLSRAVSKVDDFMKYSNVAGFVCHTLNTILLLYSVIFYPESTDTFIAGATHVFMLFINVNGLMFSASSSVVVNHMVCIRLHY